MDDCLRELQRLADFIGKHERAKQVEVQEAVQEFTEPELQHYRATIRPVQARSGIDLCARALYIALRISASFGGNEINERLGLDEHIYEALAELSHYSFQSR